MVCSYIEGVPIARELNRKGISCVIVYYRVRKKALFPNPQDDLQRAVSEIFLRNDELMLDLSCYSVWGSSAGGHLAASFGTTSMGYRKYGLPKPGLIVCAYPVVSLETAITHNETRNNLLGKGASEREALDKSIHTNVDADYPPCFVWCGDDDRSVPTVNTELLRDALIQNGIPHRCIIYPGVGHGVGPGWGTAAEGWIEEAVTFWQSLEKTNKS